MIPIKTEQWDVTQAGYLEIDLVSHAGANADGEYLYTLDAVDIHTGWGERQAVRGKGQHGILTALQAIARQLPFALRGIDSDNVLHQERNSHKRKISALPRARLQTHRFATRPVGFQLSKRCC